MKNILLNKINNFHFIGIGGIGVSAIARMMLGRGKVVGGSDTSESRVTDELKKLGAVISIGHKKENVPKGVEAIIYTIAVPESNPEIMEGKSRGLPMFSYPEFLGLISENMFTIAVSGTHGKTTTTAMISDVLWNEGINPTVVVGSLLKNGGPSTSLDMTRDKSLGVGSNFIEGDKPTFVWGKEYEQGVFLVEACEYRRSFLNIKPKVLIINNIDNDHLDYYKDIDDIISAFRELAEAVPRDGVIIADLSNKNILRALKGIKAQVVDYNTITSPSPKLLVPGEHNRKNAKVALMLAQVMRADPAKAEEALERFAGTWRRFEYKGETANGAIIYDDYGHHPTEIGATISGFRERFPDKELTVVFQPHLYSRTKLLLDDFARVLAFADYVIVTDVYAAREKKDESISGKHLADEISKLNKKVLFISSFDDIAKELKLSANKKSVVVTMGAGDIYKVGEKLVK